MYVILWLTYISEKHKSFTCELNSIYSNYFKFQIPLKDWITFFVHWFPFSGLSFWNLCFQISPRLPPHLPQWHVHVCFCIAYMLCILFGLNVKQWFSFGVLEDPNTEHIGCLIYLTHPANKLIQSGVFKKGYIQNLQCWGPPKPRMRTTDMESQKSNIL